VPGRTGSADCGDRAGVEGRHVGVVEQQLSGERCAVERPGAENGHRLLLLSLTGTSEPSQE
jgi:hypothetical protein